jgi:hypothetical protein
MPLKGFSAAIVAIFLSKRSRTVGLSPIKVLALSKDDLRSDPQLYLREPDNTPTGLTNPNDLDPTRDAEIRDGVNGLNREEEEDLSGVERKRPKLAALYMRQNPRSNN